MRLRYDDFYENSTEHSCRLLCVSYPNSTSLVHVTRKKVIDYNYSRLKSIQLDYLRKKNNRPLPEKSNHYFSDYLRFPKRQIFLPVWKRVFYTVHYLISSTGLLTSYRFHEPILVNQPPVEDLSRKFLSRKLAETKDGLKRGRER